MRNTLTVTLTLALLAGATWAQGAGGGGAQKPTLAQQMHEQLKKQGFAGPGYVQQGFLDDLKNGLVGQFGETKGSRLFGNLTGHSLTGNEMTNLLNGDLTKGQLGDWFGAGRGETDGCQAALDGAVDKKNRCMFFGILVIVLVMDMDVDPTSDFCQQVAGSRDQAPDEDLKKLRRGARSKGAIENCFGFKNKRDLDFMEDALKQMASSPCCDHPLAKSLGMASGKKCDPSQFPPLEEGMPGCGGDFAGGAAGGMPFPECPPCPFLGENVGDIFESCKKKGEADEGSGDGG